MEVAAKGSVSTFVAGQELTLLPGRAMFWPAEKTLFVADLHLGKGAAFRAGAIPVPSGSTQDTLCRLSGVLEESAAEKLCILGDLWHAQAGRTQGALDQFAAWRDRHSGLEVVLVEGNHDRKCEPLGSALRIQTVPSGFPAGPFRLVHEPEDLEEGYALAGHIHPGVRLIGKGDQSMVLPCFWLGHTCGVLPAFGSFTGLGRVRPEATDQVFVVTLQKVLKV